MKKRNSDIILEKFKKELPDQYMLYLKYGDKAADMLSPRGLEYAATFEDNVMREEEIDAPMTQEEAQSVLRENPVRGGIATILSSVGRWAPGFGETAAVAGDAALSNKSYAQAKKEQEVMLNAMEAENPKLYGAGVATGIASGLTVPNAASLKGLAALGAYEGGSQLPLGDDELKSRLWSTGLGAGLGYLGGKVASVAKKGFLAGQREAARSSRNIPEEITQAVIESPDLMNRVTTQPDAIADVIVDNVNKLEDKYGKMIGAVMEAADKLGKEVDLTPVIQEIDRDILKIKSVKEGMSAADRKTVEFLEGIKTKYLSPEAKKSLTMYPENELIGSKTVEVPVVSQPYKGPKDTYLEKRLGPSTVELRKKIVADVQRIPPQNISQTIQPAPYGKVSPTFSQSRKVALKDAFSAFEGASNAEKDFIKKYTTMIGQEQRAKVPGFGMEAEGAIRSSSNLPGDVWGRLQDKVIPEISQSLFGTKDLPSKITTKDGLKAASNIFENTNGIVDKLKQVLSPEELSQIVDDAKAIVVQNVMNNPAKSDVRGYLLQRGATSAALAPINPVYWLTRLAATIGGAAISSPKAIQKTGKFLQSVNKPMVGRVTIKDIINRSGRTVGTSTARGLVE